MLNRFRFSIVKWVADWATKSKLSCLDKASLRDIGIDPEVPKSLRLGLGQRPEEDIRDILQRPR
ncbi:hypothetical protein SAMN05428969_3383 [Devosia sp. YR412]|uniref:hypothetical protein n=1 Tax=Devosia sp. YR412 TaxID=1881030 RepID=UPI0008C4C204|nr:hypothetical protein [Devosia sp. YR412]SEQ52877.1 hypothetical protein SAMN05428969_3383 [Devosia sp. YR412]